jgi:aminopeptidase N
MLFSDMVGEERFLTAYRAFIRRWEGKHPTPFDLFYTMNDLLGENFNWFWNAWYMDFGYPDLGIEYKENLISVKRMGARALPLPVTLNVVHIDGTSLEIHRPMDIWKDGTRHIDIEMENPEGVHAVSLDTKNVPDIDPSNNHILIK